jgi:hypothetical protein
VGDLVLAPKLVPEQFDSSGKASVEINFANRRLIVTYHNPKKIPFENIRIKSIKSPKGAIPFVLLWDNEAKIDRKKIQGTSTLHLNVELEEKN